MVPEKGCERQSQIFKLLERKVTSDLKHSNQALSDKPDTSKDQQDSLLSQKQCEVLALRGDTVTAGRKRCLRGFS